MTLKIRVFTAKRVLEVKALFQLKIFSTRVAKMLKLLNMFMIKLFKKKLIGK